MLEGITVLTVDVMLAGPFAGRLLSDLGATVIKIEHVEGGDPYRYSNHAYDAGTPRDLTHRFIQYNRGKQSIAVDLTTTDGTQIFNALAADADVVLENLRPGKMAEFGLDYATLRGQNEGLVYCSISGFGETGPYKNRAAVDPLIQAMSGIVDQNRADTGTQTLTGIYLADIMGSLYATLSILAALNHRTRTGVGTHIDVSMLDAVVSLFNHEAAEYSATGHAEPRFRSGPVPQGKFGTADGAITLSILDRQWQEFCAILGFEDWLASGDFDDPEARRAEKAMIRDRVQSVLDTKTTAEWMDQFLDAEVLAAPVRTVDDSFEDEALHNRGVVREFTDKALGEYLGLEYPVIFSEFTPQQGTVPRLGEDTEAILTELGYSDTEIKRLNDEAIVTDWRQPPTE